MTREQITRRLEEIFREVFDDAGLLIREDMTAEDIEDWDSIEHAYLLMSIEEAFGIEILSAMEKAENIGEMIDVIEKKVCHK